MSMTDLTVKEFIDEVDSASPAPGGGSVSALVSTLGIALGKMVAHLTVGKKKYQALDAQVQKTYEAQFTELNRLKEQMIQLIDKDTEAFNLIMDAFKLPKETADELIKRNQAIELASYEAIKVPQEVAKLSLAALELLAKMLPYGNKNAVSDIGVGTLLLYSGLEGAVLNIKINLVNLTDQDSIGKYHHYCADLLSDGKKLKDSILQEVYKRI